MKIFCNKLHYKYSKEHGKNQSENKISVLKLISRKIHLLKKKNVSLSDAVHVKLSS